MEFTPQMLLIICPFLFLAGMVDAIGGGGGLISLPAYLIAGVPIHTAIATNKMSSACGTGVATIRFIKNKLIHLKLAIPSIIMAILGSMFGAHLSMIMDAGVMEKVLLVVLPVAAFIVLNKRLFCERDEEEQVNLDQKVYIVSMIAALLIGIYDGFYGPGTGTFLIIAFTVFAKMGMKYANGQTKAINLTTNVTSLAVFLLNGQVMIPLGIIAGISNMLGGYLGAGLVLTQGSKIVRPSILLVLLLLLLKMIGVF